MDKGKNRNDLLAAGRKKLQQYRKKKDNKGSNSNSGNSRGKSSNKSTAPEATSTASSDQLDATLASGNEVGEDLREESEEAVNIATDGQVAESEAVQASVDQVEASGSTSLNDYLGDKINQRDASPSNDKEVSYSGSENPICEDERGDQSTAPAEETLNADGERTGEDCSGNETSTTKMLQRDLNPDNTTSKICTEHPNNLKEESSACINSESKISAEGKHAADSLESIKRELYLIGLSRDLVQCKLDDQTASSTELLSELMHCKSELLDAINGKEKVNLQLTHAMEEIDLCNTRCDKLETELEMSKERLEVAVLQLGALENENTSVKQENEKLKIMRESLTRENAELSTELLAQKEKLVLLESNMKETGTCLERLVEENVILSSRFNLHRSILVEADESSTNLPNFPLTSQNNNLLNLRIEESKDILGNLRSSIESTWDKSVMVKRRGGISNLIKAYESQVTQSGTAVSDEVVSAEISEDRYDIAVQFVESLEKSLNQMKLDLMNTSDQYDGEKAGENLKEDYAAIKEKIDGLSVNFHTYQDKIDNLQEKFASVQKGADGEAVRLLGQLEELQKEANDRLQNLQEERDGIVSAVSEAIQRFKSSTVVPVVDELSPDSTDVSTSLLTLIDLAIQSIETLRVENSTVQNRNKISSELILKMHDKLQNVINYSEHGAEEIISNVEDLDLIFNSYEGLMKRVQELVDEGASLLTTKKELEMALTCKSKEAEEFSIKCKSLSENLNDFCITNGNLESNLMGKTLVLEELYARCVALANKMQESEVVDAASGDREKELLNSILPLLESSIASYLQRHDQELAQIDLSKKYLYEANVMPDISPDKWALPLHLLLNSHMLPKLNEMREKMDLLSSSNIELQTQIQVLRDSLKEMEVSIQQSQLNLNQKTTELEQSEQRLSSVKEKLGIAVSKGKGLIVQRDSLKQSLQEKSNELERCMQQLMEAENKLKSYGEADRIEALESELSYVRNSYNVMRDSFLVKDSVIQRIEEVLEDLDFPEEFHARDIAEKVEVLSRMAVQSGNLSSMQGESSVQVELPQESSDAGSDEMNNRYAALERKFCELAEHNNMLEHYLQDRNDIITKWEEVLAQISMIPPQISESDPEERIVWLVTMLLDTQKERDAIQLKIESLEESSEMLIVDLEGSRKRISELNAELAAVRSEKEFFADSLDKLRFDYEAERENMRKQLSGLQKEISEKIEAENEIIRLVDLVQKALSNGDSSEELSGGSSVRILEKLVDHLLEERKVGNSLSRDLVDSEASEKNKSLTEEIQKLKGDMDQISENYQKVVGEHESAVKQRDSLLQQLQGLEELNRRISLLEEERANSLKKHQKLVAEMEFVVQERNALQVELQQLQDKQLGEVDTLNGRISLLESELELTSGQRDALQEQLNDLCQLQDKHAQEVELLNGKINMLEAESAREPEKYQQLVSEFESIVKERNVLQEQLNQVREKLNVAVRKGKGLVQQRDALKQQIESLEAEKSSLLTQTEENMQLLNRISTALHTVDAGSLDPIKRVEEILKLNADLKMAVISVEAEANKSRRATELLLAELNESQERNDMLQEELEIMKKMQTEGLSEISLAVAKLRDISFEILESIVANMLKDEGIMSYMEEFVNLMANGIDSLGDPSGYATSVRLLGEDILIRKRNHANHYPFGPKPDEWDKNLIAYVHTCIQELYDLKRCADNEASLVDQRGTHLLRSMSDAQNEVNSLKSEINKLHKENREKEEENSLLSHNLNLLYKSCSSSIDEAEEDFTDRHERDLHAALTINEDHIRSLAERLVGAIRREGRTGELKSTIMDLQRELQKKDFQVGQISSELSAQIRDGEEKIRELEKQVKEIENENVALKSRVNQLQDVEFSSNQLRERVSHYTDMLAKKEQEIESLMQALDEEEKEMEEMEIKNKQLQSLLQEKEISLKNLDASNSKVLKKLSTTTAKFDELHHLSENLIVEVENLQLQLEGRDLEISFLRQEVTRVTNELLSSDETYKRNVAYLQDFTKWVETLALRLGLSCNESDELDYGKMKEYTEALDGKLGSVVAELDELRVGMQSRDALLQIERGKVADLVRKCEGLESNLRERSTGASTSGVLEIEQARETVMNVRGGRKGNSSNNSDQIAIAIDQDLHDHPLDEDDDKAHGFKPLTMSRFVPRFTRCLADKVDGMWVSGDRLLMRQPTLRIGVLIYWIVLHAMLASSI